MRLCISRSGEIQHAVMCAMAQTGNFQPYKFKSSLDLFRAFEGECDLHLLLMIEKEI